MRISRKQIYFLIVGIAFGSMQTFGICYGWYKANEASAPRALIDYLQGGTVSIEYKNGQPIKLMLTPPAEIKPTNGVKQPTPVVKK